MAMRLWYKNGETVAAIHGALGVGGGMGWGRAKFKVNEDD